MTEYRAILTIPHSMNRQCFYTNKNVASWSLTALDDNKMGRNYLDKNWRALSVITKFMLRAVFECLKKKPTLSEKRSPGMEHRILLAAEQAYPHFHSMVPLLDWLQTLGFIKQTDTWSVCWHDRWCIRVILSLEDRPYLALTGTRNWNRPFHRSFHVFCKLHTVLVLELSL